MSVVNWLTMDSIAEEEEGGVADAVADGQADGQEEAQAHRCLRQKNSAGSACLVKGRH